MKGKKDYCRACKKEIPFTTGPYRGFCGYACYMQDQKKERKLDVYTELKGGKKTNGKN